MHHDFTYPLAVHGQEIGERAVDRVCSLIQWLYGEECEPRRLKCRIAPSIIARGEAELFGIASPRFSSRVYLPDGGFLNLRRLKLFATAASKTHSQRLLKLLSLVMFRTTRPVSSNEIVAIARNSGCIADSLISLPKRFRDRYQVIQCDLGKAYGEGESILGVPFLQHVELGGGLCAQASCFMALCLHERRSNSIWGVSEITKLASPATPGTSESVTLGGLSCRQMASFFQGTEIGLNCNRQTSVRVDRELASFALRSYVQSSIPVIVPVDLGRMWGDLIDEEKALGGSLLERNGFPLKRADERRLRLQNHALVVIGVSRDGGEFMLNDPATAPFLAATIDELYMVRRYGKHVKNCDVPRPASDLEDFEVLPVTPGPVRMPLLTLKEQSRWLAAQEDRPQPRGLLERLRGTLANFRPVTVRGTKVPNYRGLRLSETDLRLIEVDGSKDVWVNALRPVLGGSSGPMAEVVCDRVKENWLWAHHVNCADSEGEFAESFWLWNAEKTAYQCGQDPSGILICVWARKAEGREWLIVLPPTELDSEGDVHGRSLRKRPEDEARPRERRDWSKSLRASLMSSFSTSGVAISPGAESLFPYRCESYEHSENGHPIPKEVSAEVYLMMQAEVDRDGDGRSPRRSPDAVEFLAGLGQRKIEEVAHSLARSFNESGSSIIGLASFIPEIAFPHRKRAGNLGVRAVGNLVAIAEALQETGHPAHVIELVCGSQVRGLRRSADDSSGYDVELVSPSAGRDCVISNLERVCRTMAKRGPDVSLALELEPGPYFLLRDWESLKEFATKISTSRSPELRRFVGFNLDVAHWRLAGIDVEAVRRNKEVMRRIVHAHLAGHHRCAHFGDVVPLDINSPQEFAPWIELLEDVLKERATGSSNDNGPKFSGYVSLELEASRSSRLVMLGFQQLSELIRTDSPERS